MIQNLFDNINSFSFLNSTEGIGQGSFASVYLVFHKSNPQKLYALKIIEKQSQEENFYVYNEIKIHKELNNPNIIKFEGFIETQTKFYIFLEYAEKGDLFDYLRKKDFNDKQKLKFFYQICQGVRYLHFQEIIHRDIKLENILITSNEEAKLCDFGWSCIYDFNKRRLSKCGTKEYWAPEILQDLPQTKSIDIWALGILLFELFHKKVPFKCLHQFNIRHLNVNEIVFKKDIDEKIKKLILSILQIQIEQRITIEQILNHDLFNEFHQSSLNHLDLIKQTPKYFFQENDLQKTTTIENIILQKNKFFINSDSKLIKQFTVDQNKNQFGQKIIQIRQNSLLTQESKNNCQSNNILSTILSDRTQFYNNYSQQQFPTQQISFNPLKQKFKQIQKISLNQNQIEAYQNFTQSTFESANQELNFFETPKKPKKQRFSLLDTNFQKVMELKKQNENKNIRQNTFDLFSQQSLKQFLLINKLK